MDQKELRDWEGKCIQEEPPACRAGCPLGVDARAFVLAMARDEMDAARAVLEKSMPLVSITARLCEAPCQGFCIRKDLGGAIRIGLLERLCISQTRPKGKILRLPARPRKAAVVGSGPSSLAVAFDLAKKGYPVSVYHLGSAPGAWLTNLPESVLPAAILDEELQRLISLRVSFVPALALDASLIRSNPADAVYVGQDDEVAPDLLAELDSPDPLTLALKQSGWFTGGMGLADDPYRYIISVSHGREAAVSMDRFLQGASLTSSRVWLRHGGTRLFTQTRGIQPQSPVVPAGQEGYTGLEGRQEAARCIDCQCLECVRHCVYLKEHGGYPKTYARRVFNNSAIVQGARQANRFINSCSLCGQCQTLCPHDFSMAGMCLDARRQMVAEGRMPPSAHWFALEEMRSARSEEAALALHAPGMGSSARLFFPGCQLAGIRPEQTLRLYERLLELEPGTGIWLDCCAAPAHWSGRSGEFAEVAEQLQALWAEMGSPLVVTACSTCLQMFRQHLPRIPVTSAWTVLAQEPVTSLSVHPPLALSDPCTSRQDGETRENVRRLLDSAGQKLAPLPMSGELTECCGFGGLMDNANPLLARQVAAARVAQSDASFLTYCAMCRDQLAKTGKPVMHILDLLFPDLAHAATEGPASISARRINRRGLKNALLSRNRRDPLPRQPWEGIRLDIEAPAALMLEERRILEDDLRRILFRAGQSGHHFAHGRDGRKVASGQAGEVTFWVEYREEGGVFTVLGAWSHRMRIKGGRS